MIDKKYKLGICYLYNNKLCNLDYNENNNDNFKETHYLVYYDLKLKEFYKNNFNKYINFINLNLETFYNNNIKTKEAAQLMIYEPLLLESGELMAINKTFWINIFIRKVKKYINHKLNNMNFIIYRNKIKYNHFNEIIKSQCWVEKIVLNSNFKNVKSYVSELNRHYCELKESNKKLNIIDDNSGFEVSFTIEICTNNKIINL